MAQEVDTSFNSQMNFIFGNLDKSRVPFGLLKDYAFEFTDLKAYDGTNMADSTLLDRGLFYEIYKTLVMARVTPAAYATLPNPAVTDSIWYTKRTPGTVAIAGLFYQYGYLDANALANNQITVSGGQYFDNFISGVYQNPYLTGMAVGFAPATQVYMGQSFNILITDSLWLSNSKTLVDHIEVDVADGSGYRTLTPNIPLSVSYADTGLKIWNFKLFLTNSTVLQSHTRLQITEDAYGQNPPPTIGGGLSTMGVTPGRPGGTPHFYYVSSTDTYMGRHGSGSITVALAPGHSQIQKPLIVMEGFDAGRYTTPEVYTGAYSLKEFKSSVFNGANLNNLLFSSSREYDIVFVDYYDGTEDMHLNALMLEEVIRWVNANKVPLSGHTTTEKNVVLGLSIGGVVARYALKDMENRGQTHDTRLFISHDGPQQGANIPSGYQYMFNHAKNLYMRAGVGALTYDVISFLFGAPTNHLGGIVNLKNRPVVKQIAINYYDDNGALNNSVHNAWQTELTNLGYPTQGGIRNVAISNGSECGQLQTIPNSGKLLSIDGIFTTKLLGDIAGTLGFPIASVLSGEPALLLGVLPGSSRMNMHFQVNAANTNGGNQVYAGSISLTKKLFWIASFTVNLTNRSNNAPSTLSYDYFAGGYSKLKSASSNNSGTSNWFYNNGITFVGPNTFCAIPVPSALDIGSGSTSLSEADYTASYSEGSPPASPKNAPFANFITAYTTAGASAGPNNEDHISYETRNGNWLAAELSANGTTNPYPVADCSALCQISQITGSDFMCFGTPVQYSVANLTGVNYTWVVSNGLQINSGQGTNSVQVSYVNGAINSGNITCTAGNNICGSKPVVKQITMGTMGSLSQIQIDGAPYSATDNVQLQRFTQYTLSVNPVVGATSYLWSIGNNATLDDPQGGSTVHVTVTGNPGSSISFGVQPVNNCGPGAGVVVNGQVGDSGGGLGDFFVAFPNPAGSTMTITSTGKKNRSNGTPVPAKTSFIYKIYDDKGKIWIQGASDKGDDLDVDVRGLPNKTYYLHITAGKEKIVKQVIVQH